MSYSRRVVEIVEILLGKVEYTAVSEIAEALGISKRTVFREMDEVEALVTGLGMTLEKKTRLGVKLEATDRQILKFKALQSETEQEHFSQDERHKILIIELLKSREPRKFYYFSTLLGVSEATISYDMDKIEPWFGSRGIELVRKPGYGVYLEGVESQFRKAMVDFLYQNYEHQDLVAMLDSSETQTDLVETVIDKAILIKISQLLKGYEQYLENRLTDGSFMGLMIHLAIAIQRIQRGESIFMGAEILESLRQDSQFEIARNIGNRVEETFDVKFPEDELGYITMHLKGSKLKTGAIVDQNDLIITNFEITRLASNMIHEFKKLSGYDFSEDEKLLIGLVSHLRPAITRMKLNLDIRNPLLDKIKEMYPEIYRMSENVSGLIQKQFEISVPDEEIGYLAMHFGASIERYRKLQHQDKKIRTGIVCSSGIGTSSLLYSRVSKHFASLELIGQFSKEDIMLGKVDTYGLELLISTIQIDQSNYPCIKVNPLLLEEDVDKIQQAINILKRQVTPYKESSVEIETEKIEHIHEMTEAILAVEKTFELFEEISVKNVDALIKKAADSIGRESKFRKMLYRQLVERERLGSTVIHGEGVILIHAKTAAVETLQFSVWRLKRAVLSQKGESVTLAVTMYTPVEASRIQLEMMSQISKALIEEPLFLKALRSGTRAEVETMLKRRLHGWLNRQMQGGKPHDV